MVRTRVPRHNAWGNDDVVVPSQAAVRVVRRLDRSRQQGILWGVDRANRSRLKCGTPSIADRKRAVSWRILFGYLSTERSVCQVEVFGKLLQEFRVVCLDGRDRAAS